MKTAIALLLFAVSSLAADVTGTWSFAVELSVGSGAPTFVLKQEGAKISGTYSGTMGEAPVAGKLEGDAIDLTFEAEVAGEKVKVVYTGTVKSPTTMAGKVSYGSISDGTWTARKKER